MSKIEIEKREGREEKKYMNQHQVRKEEDSTEAQYAYFRLASGGGGVAPGRNNRITESANKESKEAKRKARNAIQKKTENGKRHDEMTKQTKKEQRE